jgi:DNA-binding MarR family transcriptional regulator
MGDVSVGDPDPVSVNILKTLVMIIQKAAFIDNQPVDLNDGYQLSAVEIHLIDMAGRFPGDTISELASRLGVTKSAVSQMVQKLVIKGYLDRGRELGNRKNICLHLTPTGKKAFTWHQSLHSEVDNQIFSYLSTLSNQDRQMLFAILAHLNRTIDHSLQIRDEHIRTFLSTYHPDGSA